VSIDTYDDTDFELENGLIVDSEIEALESSMGFGNRSDTKKTARRKYLIKKKLELLEEQRTLNKHLNSFCDDWDFV